MLWLSVVDPANRKPTDGAGPNSNWLGFAVAQDQRVHPQPKLVEQAMLEHETRDGAETVLHDVFTGRLLESGNGSDHIAIDHLGVVPLRMLQRRGHDVLWHAVDVVGHWIARARRPYRREDVIRAPAHQQRI